MLKALTLLAVIALPLFIFSQGKNSIVFGKIDKADLLATSCPYDKDASAEVISNTGEYTFDFINDTYSQTLRRHVRIKILKEKGLEFTNVKLVYLDKIREQITNLTAATYNLDASGEIITTKLEKNLIYDKKVNSFSSQKVFTMPNIKAGSIIEYKYTIVNSDRREWFLQQEIPVRYSKFTVDFPSIVDIYLKPFCIQPYESKDLSEFRHTIKTFTMQNIPGLQNEAFMSCYRDYLQRIEVWPTAIMINNIKRPLLRSWTEKTKNMMQDESFGLQLKKSIPRTADLDLALHKISDPFQKMNTIYDYVRTNMAWDGVENIYALSGVKSAWKDKKGTAGEINLILVNLLKDAGLDAYPMVVSTHDNGAVSGLFPDFSQFNKVMALVKMEGRQYVLDGTDKYTPSYLIPEEVMNTEGLVFDDSNPNKYWWAELWNENSMEKDVVAFQAKISESGEMDGQAAIRSMDYSRIKRARTYLHSKDEFANRYGLASTESIKIDGLELEGVEKDSVPLVQKFNFHTTLNKSGDYSYFSTNLFTGMTRNPFIADNRHSDVFFGTNQSHVIVASISIPEGYEFEELPHNLRLTMEDKSLSITRMVVAENGVLNARITLEYKRPVYSAEEYPVLKEFYKKMYELLDEQFVIRKKA